MKKQDKVCSIILKLNWKNDIVDDFQDNRAQDRKLVIADKVMVFMAVIYTTTTKLCL